MSEYDVQVAGFDEIDPRTAYLIWQLRQDVFVVEQECPYPDLDGRDLEPGTRHLWVSEDDYPIGYLRLLEEAGLVVTRRQGREKLHFLNPVPIRLVHDRWVSKYAEPWAAGLSGLKEELERTMEKVFEIYIRTTPERLWEAITDPDIRAKYNFGAGVRSDWTPGARIEMGAPKASGLLGEGEVLEIDPPRRVESLRRVRPVPHVPDRLEELGLPVLILEIERVLPGIQDHQRDSRLGDVGLVVVDLDGNIVEGSLSVVTDGDVLHIEDRFVGLVMGMRVHGLRLLNIRCASYLRASIILVMLDFIISI